MVWNAIKSLSALANETRFAIVDTLVECGADGQSLGQLCTSVGVSRNSLRRHLQQLETAGLISCERRGRTVICHARPEQIEKLLDILAGYFGLNLGPSGGKYAARPRYRSLADRLAEINKIAPNTLSPPTSSPEGQAQNSVSTIASVSSTVQSPKDIALKTSNNKGKHKGKHKLPVRLTDAIAAASAKPV